MTHRRAWYSYRLVGIANLSNMQCNKSRNLVWPLSARTRKREGSVAMCGSTTVVAIFRIANSRTELTGSGHWK